MYGIVLAVIPIVLLFYFLSKKTYKNLPPGPERAFITGNFADLDKERVHQSLHQLSSKHGPVMYLKLLQRNAIVLSSAQMLRKGFRSKEFAKIFNDKPQGFYGTYMLWGHQDVLLGPYADVTFKIKEVMRRGLEPSMVPEKVEEETRLLCDLFRETGGKDFCPLEIVEKVYAKSMSTIISGYMLPGDRELLWEFLDWSNKLLSPSMETLLKNLPFLRHFPGRPGVLFQTAMQKRDNLLRRYVDDYRASYSPKVTRGLVDACFHIQSREKDASGKCWLSDEMIKALVMDTIGGGLVATTHSVVAVILNLLHNPRCVQKMQAEIDAAVGRDRLVTETDLMGMPYCHATVLETTRLSTVVPIVSHLSTEDVEFEGYFIPKNSIIWGNFWSAHHDKNLWEDPMTFKPERFLDDKGRLLPSDHIRRQSVIPYGVGPRYCVGNDFAKVRLFVHAVSLVQQFDLCAPKDSDLMSNDPNMYTSGAVLQVPKYQCRAVPRT